MKKIIFIILIATCLNKAQTEYPVLKNYANDFTKTLNNSELGTLNYTLKNFDDSTSNQIVFLMISSLNGSSLENFTYQTAFRNKIGSQKNNNGVLFFVAKDDRKMRIEVGYGLEGALPDALASSILRNEVRPYFKQGDYYEGITAGLSAIISATKGEYKGTGSDNDKGTGIPFIFFIILFLILSSIFRRGGRGGGGGLLPWIILGSMGSRRSGGWGSGGSWGGGGGFGGFSGGGGSFGGGGASGSW